MSFSTDQKINIGIGIAASLISSFFAVWRISKRKEISSLQQLYDQGLSNNLSKKVQRKQSDKAQLQGLPVALENVTAHFLQGTTSEISFKSNQKDNFVRIECDSFHVVERGEQTKPYQLYKINVLDSLVSENILIPNLSIQSSARSDVKNRILTSASTLGIIGTLKVSTDFSAYSIEAKIIGIDLDQIKKYISDQNLYNNIAIILSGIGVVFGLWFIKTILKSKEKRIPFETSLLQNSRRT